MAEQQQDDAFELLQKFLREDPHYLASSSVYGDEGELALRRALQLFITRPELGFVWLGYVESRSVAVCVISFAISTSAGSLVAKLDDVYVADSVQGAGVGTALIAGLKAELRKSGVQRIDTSVHFNNPAAKQFYEKNGFVSLHEERLACSLAAR